MALQPAQIAFEGPPHDRWYSARASAKWLGITRGTFRLMVDQGLFPRGQKQPGGKKFRRWCRRDLAWMRYYLQNFERWRPKKPVSRPEPGK